MRYYPIGPRDFQAQNEIRGREVVSMVNETITHIKENIPRKGMNAKHRSDQ